VRYLLRSAFELIGTTELGQRAWPIRRWPIGTIFDSVKLESLGTTQEAKGDAQTEIGDALNAAKDAVDKTAAASV
jgi:hypothetical protein